MNMLFRILTAAVLIPALGAFVYFGGTTLFAALISLAALAAALEWSELHGRAHLQGLPLALVMAFIPWGLYWAGWAFWGHLVTLSLILAALIGLATPGDFTLKMARVNETVGALLFVGAPLGYLVLLRGLPAGRAAVFFLLLVIWLADSAAYFVGVTLGRTPMAPALSPKKTMEGLLACLLGGLLGGLLLGPWLLGQGRGVMALVGLSLAALGQAGDLFESLWKRAAGTKDSGRLFPGHGGMLDRMDSFILTAPALYYFLSRGGCCP